MASNIVNSSLSPNFHGVEKPNDYFRQIDNKRNFQSQKIEKDFGKLLKSNQVTAESKIKESVNLNATSKKSNKNLAVNKSSGTDFALKKISEDFEKQILGIMWNIAFGTLDREFQGGLGEEIFQKELINEMVKLSETGQVGDIAQSIYNELKKNKESGDK